MIDSRTFEQQTFSQFAGLNNVTPPELLDAKLLSVCNNLLVDNAGRLIPRPGFVHAHSGVYNAVKFWQGRLYAQYNGQQFVMIDLLTGERSVLATALGPVAYVETRHGLFVSTGKEVITVTFGGEVKPCGVPTPARSSIRAARVGGSLPAWGNYKVQVTYIDKYNRESAPSFPLYIGDATGVEVSIINAPPEAVAFAVYVNDSGSETPFFLAVEPIDGSIEYTTITEPSVRTVPRRHTATPLPAFRSAAVFDGRVFYADNVGLWFTDTFDEEYVDSLNGLAAGIVDVIAAVEDGLYYAHYDTVWFLSRGEPFYSAHRVGLSKFVRGTAGEVEQITDGSRMQYALFADGLCLLGAGGQVKNLTRANVQFPSKISGGANQPYRVNGSDFAIISVEEQ